MNDRTTTPRGRLPYIYVTTQIDRDPSDRQVDLAVSTLKLLADGTRLRIIWALVHGEHSVNELAAHLGVNPAGVSQHLAKLRLARLVTVRREGNRAYYAVESPHVRRLAEEALFQGDHLAAGPLANAHRAATHSDVGVVPRARAREGRRARAR